MDATSQEQFIDKTIQIWGLDYVSDLFDKGYEPELLTDRIGKQNWVWILQLRVAETTNRYK